MTLQQQALSKKRRFPSHWRDRVKRYQEKDVSICVDKTRSREMAEGLLHFGQETYFSTTMCSQATCCTALLRLPGHLSQPLAYVRIELLSSFSSAGGEPVWSSFLPSGAATVLGALFRSTSGTDLRLRGFSLRTIWQHASTCIVPHTLTE